MSGPLNAVSLARVVAQPARYNTNCHEATFVAGFASPI